MPKYLCYDRLKEYDTLIKAKIGESLESAKAYADSAADQVKNDLLNGAGGAYDTLKELGDLINENVNAIDALETVASGKADAEHTHSVATASTDGFMPAADKEKLDTHFVSSDIESKVVSNKVATLIGGRVSIGAEHNLSGIRIYSTSNPSNGAFYIMPNDSGQSITITNNTNANAAYNNVTISGSQTGDVLLNGIATPTADNSAVNKSYVDGVTSNIQTQLDGKAASSHNQASNTINAMTDYSKPSSTSAISASDSLNAAIGKLEKALDGKGTSNLTIGTTSTTAAAGDHTHDDKYYTEAEIDSKVSTLNSAIGGKANSSHTHTIANITNLQATLDGKAASGHTHNYAPSIIAQTADPGAGSTLATGTLLCVYE